MILIEGRVRTIKIIPKGWAEHLLSPFSRTMYQTITYRTIRQPLCYLSY